MIQFAMRMNTVKPMKATAAYFRGVSKGFPFENPRKELAFARWKANPRARSGTAAPGFAANSVITV